MMEDWRLERIGGSKFYRAPPIFDKNDEKLYCVHGSDVVSILVQTGEFVSKLSHTDTVVSVQFSPVNDQELITCTSNGELYTWDVDSSVVLNFTNLPMTELYTACTLTRSYLVGICDTTLSAHHENQAIVFCCWPDNEKAIFRYGLIYEQENDDEYFPNDARMITYADEQYVVWCQGRRLKGRFMYKKTKIEYKCKLKYDAIDDGHMITFEAVICSKCGDVLVAGLTTGRILVWFGVSSRGLLWRRSDQTIHWQKCPVGDLVLTGGNRTLLSGGGESVLIKYTLSSAGQSNRQFLARVGAPIQRIVLSHDQLRSALVLDDNSIQIVHTAIMTVTSSARKLVRSRIRPSMGLFVDLHGATGGRSVGSLVTNGRPGHVQFFHPLTTTHLFSLDVAGQNAPDAERLLYNEQRETWSEIVRASIAPERLATLECRSDDLECQQNEMYLKFWHFNSEKRSFHLNTLVHCPHMAAVTGFEFRVTTDDGRMPVLLTGSTDGRVKIWEFNDDDEAWQCSTSLEFRNLPVFALGFSARSAVLAVGFDNLLTLWNGDKWAHLAAEQVDGRIERILWGVGSHAHCLLIVTVSSVVCWDSRSLNALWVVTQSIPPLVAVDPVSGLFAITFSSRLLLFSALSPRPLLNYLLPDSQNAICFVPTKFPSIVQEIDDSDQVHTISSRLYLMNEKRELSVLIPPFAEQITTNKQSELVDSHITPFSRMLQDQLVEKKVEIQGGDFYDKASNLQLLTSAPHTLPPVDILAPVFIRSCLINRDDIC